MRSLYLPLFLPLFGLLFITALPRSSVACRCNEPPPPLEALETYDAVFTARILTVDPTYVEVQGGDYPIGIDYTAQVYAVWKGREDPVVELVSGDPAMCGMWLAEGEEYLLYTFWADGEQERHGVSNCYRLFRLEDAGPDLEALGEPIAVNNESGSWGRVKALYD